MIGIGISSSVLAAPFLSPTIFHKHKRSVSTLKNSWLMSCPMSIYINVHHSEILQLQLFFFDFYSPFSVCCLFFFFFIKERKKRNKLVKNRKRKKERVEPIFNDGRPKSDDNQRRRRSSQNGSLIIYSGPVMTNTHTSCTVDTLSII